MGKSHNIKTYSEDWTSEYGKYAAEVKNVKRGNKKKISKHKDYQVWDSDDY
tara:strand:- start:33 stop:185 length:153 start_codon:yes stop_codon:yes gene_type:complete